jgi:hypothetical protein
VQPCISRLRGVALPTEMTPGLIATEYVPGESLRAVLDDPPWWVTPTARVIALAVSSWQ